MQGIKKEKIEKKNSDINHNWGLKDEVLKTLRLLFYNLEEMREGAFYHK